MSLSVCCYFLVSVVVCTYLVFCMLGCVFIPKAFVFFVSPFFCRCTDYYMLDLGLVKPSAHPAGIWCLHITNKMANCAICFRTRHTHACQTAVQFTRPWATFSANCLLKSEFLSTCIPFYCLLFIRSVCCCRQTCLTCSLCEMWISSLVCCFNNDNSEHLRCVSSWDESVCFTMAAHRQ